MLYILTYIVNTFAIAIVEVNRFMYALQFKQMYPMNLFLNTSLNHPFSLCEELCCLCDPYCIVLLEHNNLPRFVVKLEHSVSYRDMN